MENKTVQNPETAQQLSLALREFTAEVMKHSVCNLMRLMRQADLSMPRVVTLMYLKRDGAASISKIGEYLNLALGTTSHIVDQLVVGGFVSRVEDPADRRHKQVALTDKGRSFVAQVEQARIEELGRRLALLPPPLLGAALEVMSEVTAHLRAEAPAPPKE
jgi:DNA-binding MarR family transcriptional regulator